MMNLIVVYKCQYFPEQFFVAGTISCLTIKTQDKLSLQMKTAKHEDKLFIKNKIEATKFIKDFKIKDFYPIKKYFEFEGYEIGEKEIKKIKDALGGATAVWVNWPESQV